MVELRRLGSTGLHIAPLVLGGNVFGWTADREASFAILDAFLDGGGTMVDTADVYSAFVPGNVGGESETMIGDWLAARGRRNEIQIATKVGLKMPGGEGLSAQWIERGVEDSLRRLRTDHIDLYYVHRDRPETPQEETLEAFDRLVKAGKVRAIAASNYEADRLASALDLSEGRGIARFGALQPFLNLLDRAKFSAEYQQLCIDRDVGIVPYSALASGFLTGKYRTSDALKGRPRAGAVSQYMNERGLHLLDVLDAVSAETGATPAQLSLAWLAAQPGITAPIASATSVAQLEELLGAMRLTLSPEHLQRLDAASR